MATSGTTSFNLIIAEIIDEAFSRIGISASKVTLEHLVSARRSLNLLQQELRNRFPLMWKVEDFTFDVTSGTATYDVDASVRSIVSVVYRDAANKDIVLLPMSRSDYFNLYDKNLTNTIPRAYYFDKDASQITIIDTPVNSNEQFLILANTMMDDASAARFNLDVPEYFLPTMIAGLTAKLAEKYAPARLAEKLSLYEAAKADGSAGDNEGAGVSISFVGMGVYR